MDVLPKGYTYEPCSLSNFKADQCVILKKKYLPLIKNLHYVEELDDLPTDEIDWSPAANTYYPYTEDVDAYARVNHLLEEIPTLEPPPIRSSALKNYNLSCNPQEVYLRTKPLSFLIIGKPGLDETKLGRRLAAYWKCEYIDPKILIEEEIASGRRSGECIEFNLRSGRAIGVDVILRLLPKKLQTLEAEHRGFILCGFPLIPNDLYEDDPISSESAVFNVREIFEEMFDLVTSDIQSDKVEVSMVSITASTISERQSIRHVEVPDIQIKPVLAQEPQIGICGPKDIAADLRKQIDWIFGVFTEPFMIIYMYSSNADAILKRENYVFDFTTGKRIDMQKLQLFAEVGTENEMLARDVLDDIMSEALHHLVHLPKDFRASVATQLDHYHEVVAELIDSRIMLHDQQFFVKVDGRTYISTMMNVLVDRLTHVHISQYVLLPRRFHLGVEVMGESGEPPEPEPSTLDEAFARYVNQHIVGPRFRWTLSDWGYYCPVSMAKGIYKKGNPKFAVHFMNRVFFLADEEAWYLFDSNPRSYLLPPYPKVGKRLMLFGPTNCGKTAIAQSLHYLYGFRVLSYEEMELDYMKTKMDEFKETVRQSALTEALELLKLKREEEFETMVEERQAAIDLWQEDCIEALNYQLRFAGQSETHIEDPNIGTLPFPISLHSSQIGDTLSNNRFAELNLPDQLDFEGVTELIQNRQLLCEFLPQHLSTELKMEPITVLDPFVMDYVEMKVQEVTVKMVSDAYGGNLLEIYTSVLRNEEHKSDFKGWILDGMSPNAELVKVICEMFTVEEVILLYDTPDYAFLKDQFMNDKHKIRFEDYSRVFNEMGEHEVALKCPTESTDSMKREIVLDFLEDVIDVTIGEDLTIRKEAEFQTFIEDLKIYDEKIEIIKSYFNEIEIEILELPITNLTKVQLIKNVINKLHDKYRQLPNEYTEDDRARDVQIYLAENATGGAEGEGGAGGGKQDVDNFAKSRRYGEFGEYCPVTFAKKWVIWRGKEDFAVKFDNNLYLSATKSNMNKFMELPRKYLKLKSNRMPPPRICVIGVSGAGKTTISKMLARNLGVYYISYNEMFQHAINAISGIALHKANPEENPMMDYEKEICNLWFDEPYRSCGFVLDDFPQTIEHFEIMLKFVLIPDMIINIAVNHEMHSGKMINQHLEEWKIEREEEKQLYDLNFVEICAQWEAEKKIRYNNLLEQKRHERYKEKVQDEEIDEKEQQEETVENLGEDLGITNLEQTELAPPIKEDEIDDGNEIEIKIEEKDIEEVKIDDELKIQQPEVLPPIDIEENAEQLETDEIALTAQVSINSIEAQKDIDEVIQIVDYEYPEPIYNYQIGETEEEALEFISNNFEVLYNNQSEAIDAIRFQAETELIPWKDIDGSLELKKTIVNAFYETRDVKFRTDSFFEHCQLITVETAEKLLREGYYFLSQFGRVCPVLYHHKDNFVIMYAVNFAKNNLHPVIHRQYIYFISNRKAYEEFIKDPLKYITDEVAFKFVSTRFAVIGPPKSGKTTLARRIGETFGFQVISRGWAINYHLKYFPYTTIAKQIQAKLRRGDELTEEMVIESVRIVLYCVDIMSTGVVFDGYPMTVNENNILSKMGHLPHLIFNLKITENNLLKFSQLIDGIERKYLYSKRFIKHLYDEWKKFALSFYEYTHREFQNIYNLKVDKTCWGVFEEAKEVLLSVIFEIKHYYKHIQQDWPLSISNLIVTPLEFLERQSCYKNYCPVCLAKTRKLVIGGDPPDRTGLIHFRQYFYWICAEHFYDFLKIPEMYIPPMNILLPADLPIIKHLSVMPQNLYENGICLVCYSEHFPKITMGILKYAVEYIKNIYLFDTYKCLTKFVMQPMAYYGITSVSSQDLEYAPIDVMSLPTLGFLEQFVARKLVKAVTHVSIIRPVIPGLSIEVSALICIGLQLKLHNLHTPEKHLELYRKGLELFYKRKSNLIEYLAQMKKFLNPYLTYEEPQSDSSSLEEVDEASEKSSFSEGGWGDATQFRLPWN